MNKMIEKLKDYGADMEGAMGRFLDDVELYETCFVVFLKDESFPQLGDAIVEKDYEKAFTCAHTLKGVAGNMGLTPIYQVICKMVENLRGKKYSNLQEDYAEIVRQLEVLKEIQKVGENE